MALDARITVGAGVATERLFAVVGAGVTSAGPSATLLSVKKYRWKREATLVVQSTTAVLELARVYDLFYISKAEKNDSVHDKEIL